MSSSSSAAAAAAATAASSSAKLSLRLRGWEDGQPVERELDAPDRWAMHAADRVTLAVAGVSVAVNQRPHAVTAAKLGVGACAWDGEVLLAAYLAAACPRHRFVGMRVIELGAGPGLAGLVCAKMGARVTLTDKAVVLPLIEENVRLNGLGPAPTAACGGSAEAEALEWGAPGYDAAVRSLARRRFELVMAADCCYVDGDGRSPSTRHFVAACAGLCDGARTRVLVSFELRSSEVKAAFLAEARRTFARVRRVPQAELPRCLRPDHIELYELREPAGDDALAAAAAAALAADGDGDGDGGGGGPGDG